MQPFIDPVAGPDGSLFDLTSIVPFLRKHGKHPVTGEPLSAKDLVHLHFHRNTEGEFSCPVTNKVFNEHTKIVAIRTTGNVYAWDAIANLCIATKSWKDLLTDEPFTRADVLTLQDPTNADWVKKRDVNTFFHVRAGAGGAGAAAGGTAGGTAAAAGAGSASAAGSGSGSSVVIRSDDTTKRVLAELAEKERDGTMPTITGVKRRREDDGGGGGDGSSAAAAGGAGAGAGAGGSGGGGHVTGYGVRTTGRYTASFTSTGMSLVTRNEAAPETAADRRERRWAAARKLGKKAYVRISTSKGALNVELHADLAPRCVDNFLALARRGYYNRSVFHRLVRNFIVQGGDPSGTGRGGECAWGGAFADEFHGRLSHGERGVLSMANSGPNSNKSQFFFVLAPAAASHLDNKHSVFGRIVGGMDVLRAIEQVPTRASEAAGKGGAKAAAALASDPDKDRPLQDVTIDEVTIFSDPFAELEAAGAIPSLTEGSASGGAGAGSAAAGASSAGAGRASSGGSVAAAAGGVGVGSTARAAPASGSAAAAAGVGAGGGSLLLSMLPAAGTGGAGSSSGSGAGSSVAAAAPAPGSAAIAAAARAAAASASGSAISGGGASIAARLAAGTSAIAAPGRVVTPAEVAAARAREAERAAVTWMSDPAPKPGRGAAVAAGAETGGGGAGAGVGRYLPPAAATGGGVGGSAGSRASATSSAAAAGAAADREALLAAAMAAGLEAAPQPKRKPAAGSFGNFSGW